MRVYGLYCMIGQFSKLKERNIFIYDSHTHQGLLYYSTWANNKISQTGWLKQQKLIFWQFWRLKVQDQGAGRVGFSWGLPPWLADSAFLLSHRPFLCVCTSPVCLPLLKQTTVLLNWGLPFWLHLTLIISIKALLVTLGIRPSTYEFWGDTIQSITVANPQNRAD